MKYVKTFESHKNSKKQEPVNEELLGGVINFFKNLWNKALGELEKLGDKPKQEDITNWISKNTLNTADDSYMFKQQMDDFKKKPEANDQDCLTLVDGILNPETGALGKQGLQPMMDALNKKYPPKQGETMHWIPADTQYVFQTVRNKAIVQYKFAGGPTDGKIDPKKINVDLKDLVHLPDFKKLLTAATDNKKKKEVTITWIEKTLVPQLVKFEQSITGDELDKNLVDQKITFTGTGEGEDSGEGGGKGTLVLEWGDVEIEIKIVEKAGDRYEIIKSNSKKLVVTEGKSLYCDITGEVKKGDKIKLEKLTVSGEGGVQFKIDGNDFYETGNIEKITLEGKEVENYKFGEAKAEGQEDLSKKLSDLKTKNPENIKKVGSYVDFISDEANKDKVAEIDKIIGGGEAAV
jgi:hypothetical protein